MAKIFTYRGKVLDELKRMDIKEFIELLPARQRRSLKKGFTDEQKILLKNLRAGKNAETHLRNMIIIPEMVGKMVKVYRGNRFEPVAMQEDMMGHYLGEFVLTRKSVKHSAPGIGATRSSASISVK